MTAVAEAFLAVSELDPERIALVDERAHLTYGQVRDRAGRIAADLAAAGVGADDPVLLCAERSVDPVCGIVAIALAGGTYTPIDPGEPRERLERILHTADPVAAVVDAAGRDAVGGAVAALVDVAAPEAAEPLGARGPSELCYLLYTSGSTGVPKGVEVTHRNLSAFLTGAASWAAPAPSDRWASFHAFTFDISVWEIWGALTTGASLLVLPRAAQLDPDLLAALIEAHRITRLCQTPTAARQLAAAPRLERLGTLTSLFVCGERLDFETLRPFLPLVERGLGVWNLYGPTETTIYATGRRLTERDVVAERRSLIGTALPHVGVDVRDVEGAVSPEGEVGEIWIRGPGVARGYRRDERLTRERFVAVDRELAFRTGDLARAGAEGLEFVGRSGGFVKVRGFRVEPDEVAAALRTSPDVSEAAVVDLQLPRAGHALVAAVTAVGEQPVSVVDLRRFVARKLPEHMRPARIVVVDSIPRLPSAKIDRVKVRELVSARLEAHG
jgi:amino acid adenylation domain-containing protein